MSEETKVYNPNDAWDDAENPAVTTDTIWGKVFINANYWFFPGNGASPEPYDPQRPDHAQKKPAVKINFQIAFLPEMMLTFDQKLELYTFSEDYTKKVLPSIRALNLTNDGKGFLKALNEKWVKVEKIEGFTPNRKNPERGNYKTWEFKAVFADEEACRRDYAAIWNVGGAPWPEDHSMPSVPNNDPAKQTALVFARVFVDEACKRCNGNKDAVLGYLEGKFMQNPDVGDHLKADSPEVLEMIDEWIPEALR